MKSTQRIGLILALVFLMPALLFSVYEISSLNKDEKMIQDIYQKQLEAILFSVNQYSDDVLYTWIARIESGTNEVTWNSTPSKFEEVLGFSDAVNSVFLLDSTGPDPELKIFSKGPLKDDLRRKLDSTLRVSALQINQLVSYKVNGFQKVIPLEFPADSTENLQCMIFIAEDQGHRLRLAGLLLNPELFISELVGPRLQIIARDQFVLSAFREHQAAPFYSTRDRDSVRFEQEAFKKDFWMFPAYALGIYPQGASLHDVVKQRTNTNLLLLLALDAILIIAVVLVFRNVKREVQLAQNKADFVSNVSHEIRTPLALISMFAETLEMGRAVTEEKKKEYYSIISKETQRLSGIVNKILNFSQTEANKKTLNPEKLITGTVILEVLNTYDFHLRNKGFEYSFSDEPDVAVVADKEAFVESLINLIDNAMKYSADEKRIEVKVATEKPFGVISVKDYGVGISTMDQKHIFDKFYRVSSGNLAKSRGTGLGLSLVKQLMEAQHGKISVSSEPGKGSTFKLFFPLATP